ncbi:hypothetical protein SCLCIDRAFT_716062 [Scleroderma citrinum Foug A]|uniref:Uncharacterized protein n=1 Tax=Scleroderma citrinum Foug A TaxID=1036808 RepID=A0A0C3A7H0_9AGAM|nr:hypothetical protein SCLCIDRAFT_716062 [Scleroderma citrinum Foug A]
MHQSVNQRSWGTTSGVERNWLRTNCDGLNSITTPGQVRQSKGHMDRQRVTDGGTWVRDMNRLDQ